MPVVVNSVSWIPDGVRFGFRDPYEKYSLELYPGSSFTGLATITLHCEGESVARYIGHDELARKLPSAQFVGEHDEQDLRRYLLAAQGYAFDLYRQELASGHGNGNAARLWKITHAADYDERELSYLFIKSGKNQPAIPRGCR